MVEIVTVEGPLEPRRLRWVADLYGRADPKYREDEFLTHLFTQSPAGAALHAFAMDGERPVGHCAVVPIRARKGSEELRCGKLEALFLEESHRGRRPGEGPVVGLLLERLYAFADELGFDLVHAYATPAIGRVIRFLRLTPVGRRTLVSVMRSRPPFPDGALAFGQRAIRELARAAATTARSPDGPTLRLATPDDVDLAAASLPPPGRWTVLAGDAWDWYASSPLVRVLELSGQAGSRALVQLPGAPGEPLRLVGWRPERPGLRSAALLIGAAGRVARSTGARTLRFQPWASPAGDHALGRACRLLGFLPRNDLTTLWVRTRDPELASAEAVVATPLLNLGF